MFIFVCCALRSLRLDALTHQFSTACLPRLAVGKGRGRCAHTNSVGVSKTFTALRSQSRSVMFFTTACQTHHFLRSDALIRQCRVYFLENVFMFGGNVLLNTF